MKGNILIGDSDKTFVQGLKYSLEQDKYQLEEVSQGKSLIDKLEDNEYEMIIVDLDMVDIDGLDLIKQIRDISYDPLIVLSKDNSRLVGILALEYGADDFMTKPLDMQELQARIKALLRREKYKSIKVDNHIFRIKNIVINSLRRKITIDNMDIDLTGKEFDLFYVLSTHPGKVFTREELLEKVWGYQYFGDIRTVDVHVRRVREKIENKLESNDYIMTKWGVGYYFNNL